jgi:formiminotetrahydrofolate cyclodeaminase
MKSARQMAIQEAWRYAAQTPLDNAEGCLRVCELGAEMVGRVNPKVLSDFNCSLLLSRAGFLGCLENVAINLPSLKDPVLMNQLSAQADALRARFEYLSAA